MEFTMVQYQLLVGIMQFTNYQSTWRQVYDVMFMMGGF